MTIKLNVLDNSGASKGEFAIEDTYLEFEKGQQSVHDVVVAYTAGLRSGSASTKNRSEVRGGGAKPTRQKGLGRARTGSSVSPIWRGGGITFGPKPRSYAKKVNKKVRALALKRAFSERAKDGSVVILDELKLADFKTKNVRILLNNLKSEKTTLLVVADYDENSLRASANINAMMLNKAQSVNVYQLLRYDKIIFTQDAMDSFLKRIEGGEKSE